MKLGAQNRNSVIMAAVLAVVALFMVWRTFFSGSGEVIASKPPVPVQTSTPKAGPPARRIRGRHQITSQPKPTVTASLDPRLRFDLLKGSEETEYKGAGRNIFRAEDEIAIDKPVVPPIRPNPNPAPVTPSENPGPPPPPPINIKFFGFANRAGEPRQVFLLQNDDVFIAKENDVINRRYKVVKINNNSVEIEDLLANNKQTIPLTAG
jgi:hypothetical protein